MTIGREPRVTSTRTRPLRDRSDSLGGFAWRAPPVPRFSRPLNQTLGFRIMLLRKTHSGQIFGSPEHHWIPRRIAAFTHLERPFPELCRFAELPTNHHQASQVV